MRKIPFLKIDNKRVNRKLIPIMVDHNEIERIGEPFYPEGKYEKNFKVKSLRLKGRKLFFVKHN